MCVRYIHRGISHRAERLALVYHYAHPARVRPGHHHYRAGCECAVVSAPAYRGQWYPDSRGAHPAGGRCLGSSGLACLGGAGLQNLGTATLTHCTFIDNANFNTLGGGIENQGTLTIHRCTFTNNQAPEAAGSAIANRGTLLLTPSTLTGNSAPTGAALQTVASSSCSTALSCLGGRASATVGRPRFSTPPSPRISGGASRTGVAQ